MILTKKQNTINIPQEILDRIDLLVNANMVRSRSELVRNAMDQFFNTHSIDTMPLPGAIPFKMCSVHLNKNQEQQLNEYVSAGWMQGVIVRTALAEFFQLLSADKIRLIPNRKFEECTQHGMMPRIRQYQEVETVNDRTIKINGAYYVKAPRNKLFNYESEHMEAK